MSPLPTSHFTERGIEVQIRLNLFRVTLVERDPRISVKKLIESLRS